MSDVKRERFVNTLTSAYNQEKYLLFLKEFLVNIQIIAPNKDVKPWNTFSAAVDHYYHIGNYVGDDGKKVALFSVCLKNDRNLENARSMQRGFVKSLLENSDCAGALVAFYNAEELDKWRLSLVRMDYEFSKGKISAKLTPAKRYSYLVGDKEPCHTAQERLYPIFRDDSRNPNLDDLEEAFSVEAVTRGFFDKYKEKYLDLKESLDNNAEFVAEAEARGFNSEQFAKKLMGQIVFLYFIQKKGWLGVNAFPLYLTEREYKAAFYRSGQKPKEIMPKAYKLSQDGKYVRDTKSLLALSDEDQTILSTLVKGDAWGEGPKDFMRQIFDSADERGSNFFDDYLEPLFYTGLNQNRGDNAYFPAFHRRIPFLNGGLFEQMEGYDWENNNFSIPNEIFSNKKTKGRDADGILDVFDRYNFTMAEDEPMEREVAIDPEMLGKVFENLLDVSDRKSKGAFYTPREIVHYMCKETLINYLVSKTGIFEEDIRKFVLLGEYFRDEDVKKTVFVKGENGAKGHFEFDKNKEFEIPETIFSYKKGIDRLKEIDDLLSNVKIVDLAVGSGAFPLGMLNEIVKARDTITTYMTIDMNAYQRLGLRSARNIYRLKRDTIKNCIFACDIEPSATDITKLRLWLSLVIDNQIMDEANDEFGYSTKPRELPNLDCNIICGNSLIDEYKGIVFETENEVLKNESQYRQHELIDQKLASRLNELIDLQSKLYDEKDHVAKDSLKDQIQDIYNTIVLEQLQYKGGSIDEYYQAIKMPSQPFILWQLYFPKVFRDNGGFDIVIGNPPYVGEKGNKELFRPIAATKFGENYYYGKMDLFYFFFHKAIDLGTKEAEIAFITTNYYPTAFGGKVLREDFKKRTQIRKLINFNELKIFESALGQHNMITILTKSKDCEVIAKNSFCKINGVATNRMLDTILYAKESEETYFDVYDVNQHDLYDGEENYIRLAGIGVAGENSVNGILSKIADAGKNLKDIANIKQGIVSGADKYTDAHESKYHLGYPKGMGIFVLRKSEVENLDIPEQEKKYVKEVYKNSQISKYHIEYSDELKVLYMTKEVSEQDAPFIINYLSQFKPILAAKREAVEGKMPWYSLNWARDKAIFEADEKIVNSRRAKSNIFALETRKCYEQSDLMITVIKEEYIEEYPPKYVLGLLNSKLYYLWLKNKGKLKGDMLELYGTPLEEIPIKVAELEERNEVVDLVDKLLNDPENPDLMEALDSVVYRIFGITEEERKIVEENNE